MIFQNQYNAQMSLYVAELCAAYPWQKIPCLWEIFVNFVRRHATNSNIKKIRERISKMRAKRCVSSVMTYG